MPNSDDERNASTSSIAYQGGASLSRPVTAPQPLTTSNVGSPPTTFTGRPVRPIRNHASKSPMPGPRVLSPPLPSISNARSNSTSPSPLSLQSALFNGLLNATLSDLNLVAFARCYRLHGIVLAGQSPYFNSLLAGGFSEQRQDRRSDSDMVHIELMPPMTRASFEFCLARLYGGGPALESPKYADATPLHPLSRAFQVLQRAAWNALNHGDTVDNEAQEEETDIDVLSMDPVASTSDNSSRSQLATPRFLLSLLATAVYLEISSVINLALESIQTSLTPWTVARFLAFACGEQSRDEIDEDDDAPCQGLERVGRPIDSFNRSSLDTQYEEQDDGNINLAYGSSCATSLAADQGNTTLFVGPEGERVGEACACWLAKWGSDILQVEEWLASSVENSHDGNLDHDEQEHAIISQLLVQKGVIASADECQTFPPLRVWSSKPDGLSARWVRGIISSDAFFVPFTPVTDSVEDDVDSTSADLGTDGEFQRYLFARRVVRLRRRESPRHRRPSGHSAAEQPHLARHLEDLQIDAEAQTDATLDGDAQKCGAQKVATPDIEYDYELDEADELEYEELFSSGIHYSHMTFRQLLYVASDICPISRKPYVRQSIVERALWESEAFKLHIPPALASRQTTHALYGTRTPGHDAMVDENPELGLMSRIDPRMEWHEGDDCRPYYLVPVDDTTRINPVQHAVDSAEATAASAASTSSEPPTPAVARKPSTLPRGAENFFGLALETRLGTVGPVSRVYGAEEEVAEERNWVAHEPCRVSIEFWGVQALKDKQRLYSSTFHYAGSFWNLYLQRIQKKGSLQLGIYLHRQNPNEAFPVPSQPPADSTSSHRNRPSSPSLAPYTDRRKQIRAFFSIFCPSHMSTSMTKFSSGPDLFSLSQSWGWKSSSLSAEFLLGSVASTVNDADNPESYTSNSSLRVTIVMGLV
ncbi:hypothetical protein OIO90_002916 [Microbotryomycetes sp. JL221]|nr:hypothetical protein OIO90_002916 [Microbotryomycetes sp. JL221]